MYTRKKDQKKAYAEFNHIVSLLNYDVERIRFNLISKSNR